MGCDTRSFYSGSPCTNRDSYAAVKKILGPFGIFHIGALQVPSYKSALQSRCCQRGYQLKTLTPFGLSIYLPLSPCNFLYIWALESNHVSYITLISDFLHLERCELDPGKQDITGFFYTAVPVHYYSCYITKNCESIHDLPLILNIRALCSIMNVTICNKYITGIKTLYLK